MNDFRTIPLGHGKAAIVDAADYEWLMLWKWRVTDKGYAYRTSKRDGKSGAMHRLILDTPRGMVSDHINGNRLDNRRSNLRICTYAGNARNKGNCSHTSVYKGVGWKKDNSLWQARIHMGDKWMHIGLYEEEVAAAVAYNYKAKELFGDHARLNPIPGDWKPSAKSQPYRLKNVSKRTSFRGKPTTSKYKGVSKAHGRWKAVIKFNQKLHYLARFDVEEDAAHAYNVKAKEVWGDRAYQNPVGVA